MSKATKGPGKPLAVNPIATMVKDALKRREADKAAKAAADSKNNPDGSKKDGRYSWVEEDTDKIAKETQYYGRPSGTSQKVGTQSYLIEAGRAKRQEELANPSEYSKAAGKSAREKGIKEGFFTENYPGGDLFPTKKYEEYKAAGKLGSVGL